MKRVLVTGASGFIGSPCLHRLVDAGYEVHAVVPAGMTARASSGVTWHAADLLDPAQVHLLMTDVRPSHLLHLAWFVAHGDYWASAENLRWLQAGLDMAREFADAGGSRAVMAGTCAEYDQHCEGPLVAGVTPLRPATVYGAAKAALHLSAAAYLAERGVSMAWGHIFYLFGPGENPARLVPALIGRLLDGQVFECAHPNDVRDFLYVGDVAGAFVALLGCEVEGDFNIASGDGLSIAALAGEIADALSRPELVSCRVGVEPGPALVGDESRLRDEVGWTPAWSRRDAIEATVEWWRSNHVRHRITDPEG